MKSIKAGQKPRTKYPSVNTTLTAFWESLTSVKFSSKSPFLCQPPFFCELLPLKATPYIRIDKLLQILFLFFAVSLFGCGGSRRAAKTPAAVTEGAQAAEDQKTDPAHVQEKADAGQIPANHSVSEGANLYKTKGCVMCHGEGAKGGVPNRYAMGGLVPPLDKVGEGYTKEELIDRIKSGVPEIAKEKPDGHVPILLMPSWADKLSAEELEHITEYLFSLAPKGDGGESEW